MQHLFTYNNYLVETSDRGQGVAHQAGVWQISHGTPLNHPHSSQVESSIPTPAHSSQVVPDILGKFIDSWYISAFYKLSITAPDVFPRQFGPICRGMIWRFLFMANWTPTNWATRPDFPVNSLSKFRSSLDYSWGLDSYDQTMKRLTGSVCLWDLRARRGVVDNFNMNIPRIGMATSGHSLQRLWGPGNWALENEGPNFPVLPIGIFPFCSWFVYQYLRKHWIDKEAVNLSLSNNTK